MATAGLAGPSGAADLLRQAMAHNSSKTRDDDPDHIGSNSSTPPGGISTPQPDPNDKRLPGILSSYFGQVRIAPLNPSQEPSTSSFAHEKAVCLPSLPMSADARPAPPLSPPTSSDVDDVAPLLSHERALLQPPKPVSAQTGPSGYPTPPASSSSVYFPSKSDSGKAGTGSNGGHPAHDAHRKSLVPEDLVSAMRRHTLSSKPLASVVTTPSVLASHISSPCTDTASNETFAPKHARDSQSSLAEAQELLTSCAPSQSTPPRTPRNLSIGSRPSRTTSPSARPTPKSHLSKPPSPQTKSRTNSSTTTDSALLDDPRGRLSVYISEGRGLRPSASPYVICQFQANEYISKGPQDKADTKENDSNDASRGVVPLQRTDSETGRAMAIPMKSRQSSHTGISSRSPSQGKSITDPVWNHDALFDVVGDHSEIDVSVYDNTAQETFLGHIRFCPSLVDDDTELDKWFKLEARETSDGQITGEVHLRIRFQKTEKKHYGPEDFAILKLIGKGTFGQVFQVRKKDTQRIYAMKVLSKKVIVQKKEVLHTIGERNILVRTAMTESPFIVGLKFSFQTPTDLYLVTDYMSGGELFWHLQKEGRFDETRAKFYIAELILSLQHLHQHDIVYRDLKPENILLDANGHIALCDFGLSKANLTKDDTTNTFCGTTEYLAPEVLLDEAGYTKMVDFWSLGVLVFEMCCGWSPFYAEDTQQMYKNIAFGKVRFPRDALSNEGRNFVKGLLNRNPKHRLGALSDAEELKAHPFFADVDWVELGRKNLVPPFKPKLKSELDTSNFDPEFTNALNGASSLNARAAALASGIDNATTPLSPTMQANFKGFTFVDESAMEHNLGRQQGEPDDDADAMDQGEDGDLPGWEYNPGSERMSGISRIVTGGQGSEEGMFGGGDFT